MSAIILHVPNKEYEFITVVKMSRRTAGDLDWLGMFPYWMTETGDGERLREFSVVGDDNFVLLRMKYTRLTKNAVFAKLVRKTRKIVSDVGNS